MGSIDERMTANCKGTGLQRIQWKPICRMIAIIMILGGLSACMKPQVHSTAQHQTISLKPGGLERYGMAFITPSTVTGQEEEKQAVALTFSKVMKRQRPEIRCVSLAETLSAINSAGLAEAYKRMFEDYRDTGIFERDSLRQVGDIIGTRYVAQLKLAGFVQGTKGRFSAFGIRLMGTKFTNIRLFLQIWDTSDGTIAWEGIQELNYAVDGVSESVVTLRTVVQEAARGLIARLP